MEIDTHLLEEINKALKELVTHPHSGLQIDESGDRYCPYCHEWNGLGQSPHSVDCPIARGRTLQSVLNRQLELRQASSLKWTIGNGTMKFDSYFDAIDYLHNHGTPEERSRGARVWGMP